MDDVMGKISELLSDEESMKQLSELVQMMMSDEDQSEEDSSEQSEEDVDSSGAENSASDLSSIFKLTGLMSAFSQSDKNAELLLALKPHLKEEKQKRVDKAVKILKLIAVWNVAKESGLLEDLF